MTSNIQSMFTVPWAFVESCHLFALVIWPEIARSWADFCIGISISSTITTLDLCADLLNPITYRPWTALERWRAHQHLHSEKPILGSNSKTIRRTTVSCSASCSTKAFLTVGTYSELIKRLENSSVDCEGLPNSFQQTHRHLMTNMKIEHIRVNDKIDRDTGNHKESILSGDYSASE